MHAQPLECITAGNQARCRIRAHGERCPWPGGSAGRREDAEHAGVQVHPRLLTVRGDLEGGAHADDGHVGEGATESADVDVLGAIERRTATRAVHVDPEAQCRPSRRAAHLARHRLEILARRCGVSRGDYHAGALPDLLADEETPTGRVDPPNRSEQHVGSLVVGGGLVDEPGEEQWLSLERFADAGQNVECGLALQLEHDAGVVSGDPLGRSEESAGGGHPDHGRGQSVEQHRHGAARCRGSIGGNGDRAWRADRAPPEEPWQTVVVGERGQQVGCEALGVAHQQHGGSPLPFAGAQGASELLPEAIRVVRVHGEQRRGFPRPGEHHGGGIVLEFAALVADPGAAGDECGHPGACLGDRGRHFRELGRQGSPDEHHEPRWALDSRDEACGLLPDSCRVVRPEPRAGSHPLHGPTLFATPLLRKGSGEATRLGRGPAATPLTKTRAFLNGHHYIPWRPVSELKLAITSTGLTDVGQRRKHNEDAYLADDALGLWVVADGMGGHAAGEVASQEATDTVFGMVSRGKRTLELDRTFSEDKGRAAQRLLEGAVQAATYMVYAMAELDANKAGMGTTISAMMSVGDFAVTAQVGDSRIYRIRGSEVDQLTEDHTLIAWQLKQGLITEDEAKRSKHRNVITRAVGNRDYVQVDTKVVELEVGDRYLLCSDGLHGYLRAEEIAELAAPGGVAAVQSFIDLANGRGGKDNITAILVEVGPA